MGNAQHANKTKNVPLLKYNYAMKIY